MELVNPADTSQERTLHCAHDMCNCEVTAPVSGEAYCTDYCANMEENDDMTSCACGHPPCDTP